MRLSRVPVLSLYQHDLVYDPGGLCPVLPIATGPILRSSGVRLSAVPTPRIRPPGAVIPCGTTTFKQLSRLDTDPADLLHPASDVCLLAPAGFATGLVASRCPWKDFHLLDNLNRFHRGRHPRLPTVTGLTRRDRPGLGTGAHCCCRLNPGKLLFQPPLNMPHVIRLLHAQPQSWPVARQLPKPQRHFSGNRMCTG
jgi:hypothetical protein